MRLRKIMSVFVALAVVLSVCTTIFAADNWLLTFNDYSNSDDSQWNTQWKQKDSRVAVSIENGMLKVANGSGESVISNKEKIDATNFYGIEFKFDLKLFDTDGIMQLAYRPDNDTYTGMVVFDNYTSNKGIKIGGLKGTVLASADSNKTYQCVYRIIFDTKMIYITVKDENGTSICDSSLKVNNIVSSQESWFDLYAGSRVDSGFYIDNTSMREITEDDMPISYTKIIEENFDSATANEAYTVTNTNDGYGVTPSGFGYGNNKLCIFQGNGAKLSLEGDSDKKLAIDTSELTQDYFGIMYLKESMNSELYVNEMTFTYNGANISGVRVMNLNLGDSGDLAYLDFVNDYIQIGRTGSTFNKEGYDFTAGNTYKVRTYYSRTSEGYTKVKVEVSDIDNNTGAVVYGLITKSNNNSPLYPEYRFAFGKNPAAGDKITILSNNIYSGSARAVKYNCDYANLRFDTDASKALYTKDGKIAAIAKVDVDSNIDAAFANTVSGKRLIVCSYAENGELKGVRIEKVYKNSGTYTAQLEISTDTKSVKAMLWDMDFGTMTPVVEHVELNKNDILAQQ